MSVSPKQFLQSFIDTSTDLVYEYEGGQINFRPWLKVKEMEALPPIFWLASHYAQRCILFGLLSRSPDGQPLFPRQFGEEFDAMNQKTIEDFGEYNGSAINAIAEEVGLLEVVKEQLKYARKILNPENEEDPKTKTASAPSES